MFSFIRAAVVMVSLHSYRNPKTEVGTRDWGTAVIGLIVFLFGGMCTQGLCVRKAVECFMLFNGSH